MKSQVSSNAAMQNDFLFSSTHFSEHSSNSCDGYDTLRQHQLSKTFPFYSLQESHGILSLLLTSMSPSQSSASSVT